MKSFRLDEKVEVLRATPGTLRAMLGGLSHAWVDARPRADSWSALDVVAHLVVGEETDWIPRTRIILEHGVDRPFEPFDREAGSELADRSLGGLLERFADLRRANLEVLDSLAVDARLDARGTHPEFGEVRLGDMLATWAVHDLSHVAQIAEGMAKRYADDVGPWRRYLPVLDRDELPSE